MEELIKFSLLSSQRLLQIFTYNDEYRDYDDQINWRKYYLINSSNTSSYINKSLKPFDNNINFKNLTQLTLNGFDPNELDTF